MRIYPYLCQECAGEGEDCPPSKTPYSYVYHVQQNGVWTQGTPMASCEGYMIDYVEKLLADPDTRAVTVRDETGRTVYADFKKAVTA